MSDKNSIKTFWEVITQNQIEIPVIQRDYAQGRISERINQIRIKFVKSLVNALNQTKNEPLHLDFVYGRIQGKDQEAIIAKNKEAIRNVLLSVQGYASNLNMEIKVDILQKDNNSNQLNATKLIPLDGQQRLTTLFLLHWYILQRIDIANKKELIQSLKGFKYKTRKSTTEFCEYLCNIQKGYSDHLFLSDKKVSEQIEKSTSFYRIWNNDPSVKGMLVMLDALHLELHDKSEEKLQEMWKGLTINKRITFDFLDLDTLDQTDELYVKMNARGKQLTDFEHFKAWLQEYIKEDKIIITNQDWEKNIDTTWLDLFWKNKGKNVFKVDDIIFNFFKSINLFEYIKHTSEEKIDKALIEKIREPNKEKNFIPLDNFKKQKFFSSKSLEFLFKTLENLSDPKIKLLDDSLSAVFCYPFTFSKKDANSLVLSSIFITEKNSFPSLWDRVYYYAFILFVNDISNYKEDDVILKFQSWMRICRNLIYNTYIQNPDNFIKAVKSINELSKHKFSVEDDLLNKGLTVSFFDTQAKEEKRKLEYFIIDDNWKEKILQYENHSYFYGQIDFIFNLLGSDDENFDLFVKYGDKLSNIFRGDIEKDNHLLQVALLTKGDYAIPISGNKYSFCKSDKGGLRARNDNWRKVFSDKNKLDFIKNILDDDRDLLNIVQDYKDINWRSYFIKYPDAINYCDNRFFDFANELDIRLLKGTTYNGKHTDLYLFILFKKFKGKNFTSLDIKHIDVNNYRTNNSFPSLQIKSSNEKEKLNVSINFNYSLNTNQKGFEIKGVSQSIIDKDIFNEFELNENKVLFKTIENVSEIENILDYIINQFKLIVIQSN